MSSHRWTLRREPAQIAAPRVSFNATATHGTHSNRTPSGVPAGRCTHAGAIDHVHTCAAGFADLRDHEDLSLSPLP